MLIMCYSSNILEYDLLPFTCNVAGTFLFGQLHVHIVTVSSRTFQILSWMSPGIHPEKCPTRLYALLRVLLRFLSWIEHPHRWQWCLPSVVKALPIRDGYLELQRLSMTFDVT